MLRQYSNKELVALLGERARIYRQNLSLSQEDLAYNAGVSLSTLQKFETGKANISLMNFLSIIRHLGRIESLDLIFPDLPRNPYKF